MKATAVAPSNIAFIKYWGRTDEDLRLPANSSISMNLSELLTRTTVEFSPDFQSDAVTVNGKTDPVTSERVCHHLDRVRKLAKVNFSARVVSENSFPSSTGLSSSAAGFAALTVAAVAALDLRLTEKELTVLARFGSGSAARSIPDGYVEWITGKNSESSYAYSLFPPEYWDICDIVAVVSNKKKIVPTSEGQRFAESSLFFKTRLDRIVNKISRIKKYLDEKDFQRFGELVEEEALELHAIMLTSNPPLIYWLPETVQLIHGIRELRSAGLPIFFTLNTGQDVHILCKSADARETEKQLQNRPEVKKLYVNHPAKGARVVNTHLF